MEQVTTGSGRHVRWRALSKDQEASEGSRHPTRRRGPPQEARSSGMKSRQAGCYSPAKAAMHGHLYKANVRCIGDIPYMLTEGGIIEVSL
jgi:hypothetical protein